MHRKKTFPRRLLPCDIASGNGSFGTALTKDQIDDNEKSEKEGENKTKLDVMHSTRPMGSGFTGDD